MPDEVLLGEATERLVRGAVETGSPRAVDAKGKVRALTAHPLVRVVPGADPLARRMDAALVGRDEELVLCGRSTSARYGWADVIW